MAETLLRRYARLRQDLDVLHAEGQRDSQVDADDVSRDLAVHAEQYRQWASMAALAEADYEQDREHLKRTEMEQRAVLRQEYLSKGGKFTEARLDEETVISPPVQEAQKRTLTSMRAAGQFRAAAQALYQRCEMLRSLNARQCKELGFYGEDPDTVSAVREQREQAVLARAEANL